ncbi:hypothetical protein Tco_0427873 [Tanacetum coccineum]
MSLQVLGRLLCCSAARSGLSMAHRGRLKSCRHYGTGPGCESEMIEVLRRERLAYEQESMETRQALARSEAYYRALEARVTVLETEELLLPMDEQKHVVLGSYDSNGFKTKAAQAVRDCSYSESKMQTFGLKGI